jgi:hypothetical protein
MKSIEKKHTQQVDFSNPNADKITSAATNTPIIKLTAVEWLIDWMCINQYFIGNDLLKAAEKAKEMEKNQIVDAFDIACEDENRIGIEYYNETFKTMEEQLRIWKHELGHEMIQIGSKIQELEKFVLSDDFVKIPAEQMSFINAQIAIMKAYHRILTERKTWLSINK